jgi:hypothetical protein
VFEFQWNALKIGDRVAVHDDLDAGFQLSAGVVQIVGTPSHAVNDVAIRLDNLETAVQRPRRHAVHLLPLNDYPPCWRCEASATQSESGGQAGWIVAA